MTTPLLPTYSFESSLPRDSAEETFRRLRTLKGIATADQHVLAFVSGHLDKLSEGWQKKSGQERLQAYASFLPPRLVTACQNSRLIPFFGSGLSIPAGIPSWGGLLDKLGLASDYLSDPQVEHDPLTQAELIAHAIGTDALQKQVQGLMSDVVTPSLAHHLLAELAAPVYITTNYDCLFEQAWGARWGTTPVVVTNDADVSTHALDRDKTFPLGDVKEGYRPVLIKMHGDAKGSSPHLILTRSDYRRHYRANAKLFDLIKELMRSAAVMFLGFSHRDPEVSRLVEDMVYRFETKHYSTSPRPLFSIQFDMRQRTPEVFAARGIVALRPPAILGALSPENSRSASVSIVLGELILAAESQNHDSIDLEPRLESAVMRVEEDVADAMNVLKSYKDSVLDSFTDRGAVERMLGEILVKLGSRAGQGVFATHENGKLAALALPPNLAVISRPAVSFADRPYFRQARMFRNAFVSDVFESKYNGHATIFFCVPLGNENRFAGLLFAAAQPGAWATPFDERERCKPLDFILVDSNGVAVVPPHAELLPSAPSPELLPLNERPADNHGFSFKRLHELSRRDSHISHIVQNIVPIGFDDDIHDVAADVRLYSMVANVNGTRWKLALSTAVPPVVHASPRKP